MDASFGGFFLAADTRSINFRRRTINAPNGNSVKADQRSRPGGGFTKLARLVFLAAGFLSFSVLSYAYDDHALISYYSLRKDLGDESVRLETLGEFLVKEQVEIARALSEAELWCRTNLSRYKPLPQELVFAAGGSPADIETRFLKSIRVDPEHFRYDYLQDVGGKLSGKFPGKISDWKELYLLNWNYHSQIPFVRIKPRDIIPAIDVISTASDIPDYGVDCGLFADNKTALGGMYGFGNQPLGDPAKLMHQQASFHMPYYHDAFLTTVMPNLKSPYAIFREKYYSEIARVAFKTKHDYWGYYFAGLALHYVEDCCLPYHVSIVPGSSALQLLWEILKDKNYIARVIIPRISAQHLFLEAYIYNNFIEERNGSKKPYFLDAVNDGFRRGDLSPKNYDMFIVTVLAKKASDIGGKIAPVIESITDGPKMGSEISARTSSGDYYVDDFILPGKNREKEAFRAQCYAAVKLAGNGARAYWEEIKKEK